MRGMKSRNIKLAIASLDEIVLLARRLFRGCRKVYGLLPLGTKTPAFVAGVTDTASNQPMRMVAALRAISARALSALRIF
jgi:hypothetical protein